MELELVRYRVEEQVGFITLNRPEVLNALNPQVFLELDDALERALADDEVNAILLAGEGKAFCAGWDIKKKPGFTPPPLWEKRLGSWSRHEIQMKFFHSRKPVLCAVQGYCFGGGYELANQADLVIAADDAVFSEPEIRLSWVPDPMTVFLVGLRHAKEQLLLGERFSAEEAYRIGLVNWVVPRAQLESESRRIAIKLARMPTETMQLTKRMLNKVAETQGYIEMTDWRFDVGMIASLIVPKQKQEFDRIEREQGLSAAVKWMNDRYIV